MFDTTVCGSVVALRKHPHYCRYVADVSRGVEVSVVNNSVFFERSHGDVTETAVLSVSDVHVSRQRGEGATLLGVLDPAGSFLITQTSDGKDFSPIFDDRIGEVSVEIHLLEDPA